MKKNIILVTITFVISISLLALYLYNRNPLQGTWRSELGDGFSLIEHKDEPFMLIIKKDVIVFQNKEYRIKEIKYNKSGKMVLLTDKLVLKMKLEDNGRLLVSFPGVGLRRYKREFFFEL